MNAALWKKAVRESQWLLLICAVGLFLFCFLRIWIVSTVEMSRFAAIIGELWEDIEKFSTVPLAHLLTYAGRIAVVYNEPLVLLIVSVWAVSRGSDVVSGEIGRGTMEMLLAQPTSRLQILLSQGVVGVVGVFVLCIASWAGSASGIYYFHVKEQPPAPSIRVPGVNFKIPLPFLEPTSDEPVKTPLREKVDPRVLLPAVTNLASLGLFLLGLTTLFSALDHQRWRTIGAASTLWVVSLAAKAIGMAVEQARWLNYCSFFTPYSPEWAVYVGMHKPDMAA
ncbi:MAG: ABC transporter permease subunit, partial [Planctomycetales bacterium]|nr:ABC transporter permease subunit [Planctomycetales bacterium]